MAKKTQSKPDSVRDKKYEMHVSEFMEYVRGYVGRTKYGKGCYGEKLTRELLKRKAAQYPEWYNERNRQHKTLTNYEYLLRHCDGKWFVADCCGLIKGIRAGYRADGTVGKMTTAIDQTIRQMVDELTDVQNYENASDGYMAFFRDYTHVMTISVQGEKDIESAPSIDGVQEVPITYQPASRVGGAGRLPWVDYEPLPEPIAEDGLWGAKTTLRAQQVFGTVEDGIVSRQLSRVKSRCAACGGGWQWNGNDADIGSMLIREMQRWLGVNVTGHMNSRTIEALQRKMGTPVDGVLSRPSKCVKAFQHWLNEQG